MNGGEDGNNDNGANKCPTSLNKIHANRFFFSCSGKDFIETTNFSLFNNTTISASLLAPYLFVIVFASHSYASSPS